MGIFDEINVTHVRPRNCFRTVSGPKILKHLQDQKTNLTYGGITGTEAVFLKNLRTQSDTKEVYLRRSLNPFQLAEIY
jgi:hypothetical protein